MGINHKQYDAVVVGGGISGLSAAYFLAKQDKSVIVLEKGTELGGLISSYRVGDYSIEKYYHHILPGQDALLSFIDELELSSKVVWLPASVGYYWNQQIYLMDTPLQLLKFPALSLLDKYRLYQLMQYAKNSPKDESLDQLTAKDWIIQKAGINVYDSFFAPLLSGKFGDQADTISAAWMKERIKIRGNRKILKGESLGYIQGGYQVLLDRLIEQLKILKVDICLNSNITEIQTNTDMFVGVSVNGETIAGNILLNTVGPELLYSLKLPVFKSDYMSKLQQIPFQHTICLTLGLSRKLTDTYWLNIADESLPFSLIVEHTNFYQQSYSNTHILYLARYVMDENDELWKLTENEIYSKYVEALISKFNLNPGDVLWWKLSKAKNTSPVYRTGFLNLRLSPNTPVKNLFNLGTMHAYPERSLDDSIRQSRQFSGRI